MWFTNQGLLAASRSWKDKECVCSPLEPQEETSPVDFDFNSVGLPLNLWAPGH